MGMTVAEVREMLRSADASEFAVLDRSLAADGRKGVRSAVEAARRRIAAEEAESARLRALYDFDRSLGAGASEGVVVGLDEVGRGAVAGPLAVGAVVLPQAPLVSMLDDSKRLSPARRREVAEAVRGMAVACAVQFVEAADIDRDGMAASLRRAFKGALAQVERQGTTPDVVLLDGNPLHIDAREVNVVKGDAASAAIAAASIVAKVARDDLMCELSSTFPHYGFSDNKGYASAAHVGAIRRFGLSAVHRASFCKSFMQESLF